MASSPYALAAPPLVPFYASAADMALQVAVLDCYGQLASGGAGLWWGWDESVCSARACAVGCARVTGCQRTRPSHTPSLPLVGLSMFAVLLVWWTCWTAMASWHLVGRGKKRGPAVAKLACGAHTYWPAGVHTHRTAGLWWGWAQKCLKVCSSLQGRKL
jgi:hypothetical protein